MEKYFEALPMLLCVHLNCKSPLGFLKASPQVWGSRGVHPDHPPVDILEINCKV